MNNCKCGATPKLTHVLCFGCTNWQVVCECGRQTDIHKYENNAIKSWNVENLIPYHGNRESLLDSTFDKCGSELLGDYQITQKGEIALKDKEIADLKTNNDLAWTQSDWFAEACDKLMLKIEAKDVQITALAEEVKYWTNAYNEQVQGREKDMMSLEAISRLLGVSR